MDEFFEETNIILFLSKGVLSVLVAFFTAKLTVKSFIHKNLFNRQKDLYVNFLKVLLKIEKSPDLQFCSKTISELESIQAEFGIFASKKCNKDFLSILKKLRELHGNYVADKDPNEEELFYSDTIAAVESDERYKDEHKIMNVELQKTIDKAVKHIRKSLKI